MVQFPFESFVCLISCALVILLYTLHKVIHISEMKCIEENEILHEIFRVVSLFSRYISCYISENRLLFILLVPVPTVLQ